MANVISLLIVLGSVFISAFYKLTAIVWTVFIGIVLLLLTLSGYLTGLLMVLLWLVYIAAACFANLHDLRQQYIVKRSLPILKAQMPSISATERAAIEAGDTWWEKELFCGSPKWKKLFHLPKPTLTAEEENFLNNQVEHLCGLLNEWDILQNEHDLPKEAWDYLRQEKFFGMVIPKEYGGLGFSALAHSTVVVKIASRSGSAAVTTMVPNSLGPGELLLHYGTDEQKQHYLPRLASGEEIPCFALTGPDAGSDAAAIPDKGIVCKDEHQGQQVIGIRLTWDKRYITLAPVATVLGLAVRLYDPDQLLGEKVDVGITLCLIPTSHPGVEIGHRHIPMDLAFMNGPTRGDNVFIPLDWIIGGPSKAGQGWRMLMECLSIGRSISLPALATSNAKVSYRQTGAYARIRRQFNAPISAFEGVEEALGYIAGYTYTINACRIMTAGAIDLKINPSIVSAIAKYHMTEMSRKIVSHAMDIHGGHAIQEGPRNTLALIYRGVPTSITVEGANILTRNLIIFGQGAIRCHPYLLDEVTLISAEQTDIHTLDKLLMKHVGYFTSNLLRSCAYGLSGGLFIHSVVKNKRIKRLHRQITRMSTALAWMADASLILLGGSLKRRERTSARLGDILSQLYLASSVLKYFNDHGRPAGDVDNVCWSLQECLSEIQKAINHFCHNFPNRGMGALMRFIVFPFGNAYQPPRDKLHNSIVTNMLVPELRDRITRHMYLSKDKDDNGFRLDAALEKVAAADPIHKRILKAVQTGSIPGWYNYMERIQAAEQAGIITAEEASALSSYETLRSEVIKVNEFSFDLSKVLG